MNRIIPMALVVALCSCAGMPEQESRAAVVLPTCRATELPSSEPVRWLVAEPDRHQLDAWCAAVGPAIVRSHPEPRPPVLDSLLVVTWNVHVGGGDLHAFIHQLRSGRLTGGEPVEHFALLLQETWRASDNVPDPVDGAIAAGEIEQHPPDGERMPIDRLARELGLSVVYVPSMRNGGSRRPGEREDRGNAILSTLRLEQPLALELPVARQRRVAVAAVARGRTNAGSDWELLLASAHLENRGGTDMFGVRSRALQAEWLMEALPPAEQAVLGADLNTWVSGPNEEAKLAVLPHFPQTHRQLPQGPTHESHFVFRARLDYLFARVPGGRMTRYQRVPEQFGSDHYPLFAWVHLPPARATTGLSAQ
jgi:endonuclease/exonuclease/phosphatase family metal-dependent hydrolase